MNRRALKFLLLVLMGWYVAGPLAEAVDHWDDVQSEIGDIARSAGGAVTVVMAGVALAIALLRCLKARCEFLARVFRGRFDLPFAPVSLPAVITLVSPSHSPPVPLRV